MYHFENRSSWGGHMTNTLYSKHLNSLTQKKTFVHERKMETPVALMSTSDIKNDKHERMEGQSKEVFEGCWVTMPTS